MRMHTSLRLIIPAALVVGLLVVAASTRKTTSVPAQAAAPPPSMLQQEMATAGMMNAAAVGHVRGSETAPVTVIEFSDFGCPFCGMFALQTYPVLEREYIQTGKVQWRYVPFVMGMFPNGTEAARAAECATEQGEEAFWAMHDMLFARQMEWKTSSDPQPLFRGYAEELELDEARFAACYDENRSRTRVDAGTALARQAGVRATPTFFVNGVRVQGALPLERFRMILDEAAK